MDLNKTLELIEDALSEVPNLRKLRYDNAEYDLWHYKVDDILKAGFGPESDEYERFIKSVKPQERRGTQWELQKWYDRRLIKRAAALLPIIHKYELLGKETIHPEVVESQKSFAIRGGKILKGKVRQLKQFLRELEKFRRLQIAAGDERLDPELDKLRTKLVRKSAQMKELLLPHGGQLIVTQFKEDFDAFDTAFTKPIYPWGIATQWHAAVNCLIQKTNETIGKLEIMSPQDSLREAVYASGTPYDAYKDIREVISLATKKLIIVDPYVDSTVVTLLENVQPSVEIQVLTLHMQGDFKLAVQKFAQQRNKSAQGSVEVRQDKGDFHDRFIVADNNFFHLGASIKDAGTKVCAINEVEDPHNRSMLVKNIRKAWDVAAKVL